MGFGGKGANQCVMAARLGAKTAMVAKVSEIFAKRQGKRERVPFVPSEACIEITRRHLKCTMYLAGRQPLCSAINIINLVVGLLSSVLW